jgi:hypothetical protein
LPELRGILKRLIGLSNYQDIESMSKFKRSTSQTTLLLALMVSSTAITTFLPLTSATAQFLRISPYLIAVNQGVIPAGTQIPVMYEENKILLTPDETIDVTLEVAQDIKDRNGTIIIPYKSEIEGKIEPAGQGSQFIAEKIVIKEGEDDSIEQSIDASSQIVNRTETIKKGASAGSILKGAAIGGAAATLIAAVVGDNVIATEKILGGVGVGALAGWLFGGETVEVISIKPKQDLTLTLESDFIVR